MDVKRIHAAAAHYGRGGDRALAERLGFFNRLWGAQECIARSAEEEHPYSKPSTPDVAGLATSGVAVLGQYPVVITEDELAQAAAKIAECLAENAGYSDEDAAALRSADWKRAASFVPAEIAGSNPAAYLDALAEAVFNEEEAGKGVGVDARTAAMVFSAAIKPMLSVAAEYVTALERSKMIEPKGFDNLKPLTCPVCGGEPTLAYVGPNPLSKGNGRMLWCGQCGAEWEYERVRCARCGTQNQGHLHYMSQEGDDLHRVHVCDECGGHIRTRFVEANDLAPFAYEVEDVVSASLELIDPKDL